MPIIMGSNICPGVGFDPKTMIDLLDKLRRWGSFGSEGIPAYMQTHPLRSGDQDVTYEDLLHGYKKQGPLRK